VTEVCSPDDLDRAQQRYGLAFPPGLVTRYRECRPVAVKKKAAPASRDRPFLFV